MNEQPIPTIQPSKSGGLNISTILIIFLGAGALIFAILAVVEFSSATNATNNLKTQKNQAATLAAKAQKLADDTANIKSIESPYRSYTSPQIFGSFKISFPKNWSGYVMTSTTDQNSVNLAINPDFVSATDSNLADPVATRVILQQTVQSTIMTNFKPKIDFGILKKSDVTISGIKSIRLVGKFDNPNT